MASLTEKIINGCKYYYARICKRINGKPTIIQTIYLGTLENIIKRSQSIPAITKPAEFHLAEFGATAALIDIADRLQFVEIIDRYATKKNQGYSVGQYMLIAALNRAIHPTSKSTLSKWFGKTVGPRILGINPNKLSSQSFWNHMGRLLPKNLGQIENALFKNLIDEFKVNLNCLLYDGTNFFTYINTRTESLLAHRGHNKQKRNDLKQVSLGMMTSSDFHIPLLHMVYGGNIQDSTQFGSVIDELIKRYKCLTQACNHITLVFDKGNNSEENFSRLPETGLHFVGSLKSSQCPDLLEIPLRRYRQMEGDDLETVKAFRSKNKIFGTERTILITYNENLVEGQLQGISHNITKTRQELHELKVQLSRWSKGLIRKGKKPTLITVQEKLKKILSREYMKKLFFVKLTSDKNFIQLEYSLDTSALSRLSRIILGKTILFTDNHSWSDEEIIHAYRSQFHIEHAFREMKNPACLCWNPRFHWTDQKIRVHAFYCVAALTLVSLLRRELASKNIKVSAENLIENLKDIVEIMSIYPQQNKISNVSYSLTHMDPVQQNIFNALNLSRFLTT
jgi:transposase